MESVAPVPSPSLCPASTLRRPGHTMRVDPVTQYFLWPSLPFPAIHKSQPQKDFCRTLAYMCSQACSYLLLQSYMLPCSNELGMNSSFTRLWVKSLKERQQKSFGKVINNVSSLLKNFHPGEGYLKMHLEINPVTRCLCRFTLRSLLYSKSIVHKSKCSCCFSPLTPTKKILVDEKWGVYSCEKTVK